MIDISELHVAAYGYLMNHPSGVIQQLIADGDLGVDRDQYGTPDVTQPFSNGWLFRADIDGAPFRNIEGTGTGAICLMVYDTWAVPTMWHSSIFPNLHIAIHADPDREVHGFPNNFIDTHTGTPKPPSNGRDRALRIYSKIHPLFHDSANQVHKFGNLPIISTLAGGGFTVTSVPSGDGWARLDQTYNIHL